MRFKTNAGHWGQYTQRLVYVLATGSSSVSNLAAAEYFIDNDPGSGNGQSFAISNGSTVSTLLNISLNGLSEGFHTLAIRFKDATGKWALYSQRMFYVATNANTAANIVAGEYLIDADPGVSIATPVAVTITPGTTVATLIDVPVAGLSEGFHTLALRFKNADGVWGAYSQRLFTLRHRPWLRAILWLPNILLIPTPELAWRLIYQCLHLHQPLSAILLLLFQQCFQTDNIFCLFG